MKRAEKELVRKVDQLISQNLDQLTALKTGLSPYAPSQERLAVSKLIARYLQDARRLIRLKSELLHSNISRQRVTPPAAAREERNE